MRLKEREQNMLESALNTSLFQLRSYYLMVSSHVSIGGVPSGSKFTQPIETIVSTFVGCYCMFQQGLEPQDIRGEKFFCFADDISMSVPSIFSIDKLVKDAAYLGFDINRSKVMYSREPCELKVPRLF